MTRYERQFKKLEIGDKVILTRGRGFNYGTHNIFPKCYAEQIRGKILEISNDENREIYIVRMDNHYHTFTFITGEIERAGD